MVVENKVVWGWEVGFVGGVWEVCGGYGVCGFCVFGCIYVCSCWFCVVVVVCFYVLEFELWWCIVGSV